MVERYEFERMRTLRVDPAELRSAAAGADDVSAQLGALGANSSRSGELQAGNDGFESARQLQFASIRGLRNVGSLSEQVSGVGENLRASVTAYQRSDDEGAGLFEGFMGEGRGGIS